MTTPPEHPKAIDSEIASFRKLTREWFDRRSDMPLPEMIGELLAVREAILDELGNGLAPKLNGFAQRLVLPKLPDKQLLADCIKGLSAAFGVKPVCPGTGLPATIITERGKRALNGRFQFLTSVEGKAIKAKSSVRTPEISFTPIQPQAALSPARLKELQSRTIRSAGSPLEL